MGNSLIVVPPRAEITGDYFAPANDSNATAVPQDANHLLNDLVACQRTENPQAGGKFMDPGSKKPDTEWELERSEVNRIRFMMNLIRFSKGD